MFSEPSRSHLQQCSLAFSARAQSCCSPEQVSAQTRLFWLWKCTGLPSSSTMNKSPPTPRFQHEKSSWLLPVNSCRFPFLPFSHSSLTGVAVNGVMKLGRAQGRWKPADKKCTHTYQHLVHMRMCTSLCVTNRAVMWRSWMGGRVGQLSFAWEAVPSSSLLTCQSYGNSSTSLFSPCSLCLFLSPSLSLPLPLLWL